MVLVHIYPLKLQQSHFLKNSEETKITRFENGTAQSLTEVILRSDMFNGHMFKSLFFIYFNSHETTF